MMARAIGFCFVTLVTMAFWAGCGSDGGKKILPPEDESPRITAVNPDSAAIGDTIEVLGTRFGPAVETSRVLFGPFPATISTWTDTRILAVVPVGAQSGSIRVVAGGLTSNAVPFEVGSVLPPLISALNPDSAAVGDTIEILGLRFGSAGAGSQVLFGTLAASTPTWTDTRILAVVPVGAQSGSVQVVVDGLASNAKSFQVGSVLPPLIATLNPDSGRVGDTIEILGSRFGGTGVAIRVLFGALAASTPTWTDTRILAVVPTGAQTGNVQVAVGDVTSNTKPFRVVVEPPPVITIDRLIPARTVVADTVNVVGSGFGATQETGQVTFAGPAGARIEATVLAWSETEIRVLVPGGIADGFVLVAVGGTPSNGATFSPAPRLISYTDDLVPLFHAKGCISCHGGQNNLHLDSAKAAVSGESDHGPVVLVRDGANSILYLKTTATPPFGDRMPLGCSGQVCVSAADGLLITDWIDQGARDN
jgi:hypothetical protein